MSEKARAWALRQEEKTQPVTEESGILWDPTYHGLSALSSTSLSEDSGFLGRCEHSLWFFCLLFGRIPFSSSLPSLSPTAITKNFKLLKGRWKHVFILWIEPFTWKALAGGGAREVKHDLGAFWSPFVSRDLFERRALQTARPNSTLSSSSFQGCWSEEKSYHSEKPGGLAKCFHFSTSPDCGLLQLIGFQS